MRYVNTDIILFSGVDFRPGFATVDLSAKIQQRQLMKKATIVIHRGGTGERTIPVSGIIVPDMWHIAMSQENPEFKAQVLECWHLAHAMRSALEELDQKSESLPGVTIHFKDQSAAKEFKARLEKFKSKNAPLYAATMWSDLQKAAGIKLGK